MFLVLLCLSLSNLVRSHILDLSEGNRCTALGGEAGTCRLLTQCYNPGDFKKNNPPICTFVGKEPVICCADSGGLRDEDFRGRQEPRVSEEYCDSYGKSCENLRKFEGSAVVLQGKTEKPYQHTYMAVIGYGDEANKVWNCGGSIITAKYILSAASCAQHPLLGLSKWARLGGLEILYYSVVGTESTIKDWSISDRIAHPDYNPDTLANDIALLSLEQEMSFDLWLGPACLHGTDTLSQQHLAATVWTRSEVNPSKGDLLEFNVTIIDERDCEDFVGTISKSAPGIDYKSLMCTLALKNSAAPCTEDSSGGPLLLELKDRCVKSLVGVASSHRHQCGQPTVFTKVSKYLSWIESIAFND